MAKPEKMESVSSSVFNKSEMEDYAKISKLRLKASEFFVKFLLSLLKSNNPYMLWVVMKELQILGGQNLLGSEKSKTINHLEKISKSNQEIITLNKNMYDLPQYYIEYNGNQKIQIQISVLATESLNIILNRSEFKEPLFYFKDNEDESLWSETAHTFYISKKWGDQKHWINKTEKELSTDFAHFVNQSFSSIVPFESFNSTLIKHGFFAEKFFAMESNQVLSNELTKQGFSLDFYKKLISDHNTFILGRNMSAEYISNYSDVVSVITNHLKEKYILEIITNPQKTKDVKNWWRKFKYKRKCVFCDQEFLLATFPDWMYFGSNGFDKCCFHCKIVQFPKDSDIAVAVKNFLDICGFIPYSDFHPAKYSFSSRFTKEGWVKAIWSYAKMGGINFLRKKYGSWINCLLETRAFPEGIRVGKRGVYCLAKDGHMCNSLAEQQIDNWLFDNNIVHEKEPLYPYHVELNPNHKKRADWIVGNKMVEFFGLPEDVSYAKRMSEKILLAKTFGLELISIFPKDLLNLNQVLKSLL